MILLLTLFFTFYFSPENLFISQLFRNLNFFFFWRHFRNQRKKKCADFFFCYLFFFCSSLFEHTGGLHAWGDHKSGQLGLGASGIAGTFFNDCF